MARFDLGRIVEGFRRAGGDEVAVIAERAYSGDDTSEEDAGPLLAALRHWVPDDAEKVNRELSAPGLERMQRFDVRDDLGRVECPSLVCVGDLDPVTPVAAAHEIAEALPGARLEVLEGAGHFTWKDAPDRYWPLLTEFVRAAQRDRVRLHAWRQRDSSRKGRPSWRCTRASRS